MGSYWLHHDSRSGFMKLSSGILKTGPIPKHVGVIMDGNRRFSKKTGLPLHDGYGAGSKKLDEVLRWAYEFGVKEVTAYVFSIENFKRTEAEQKIIFRYLKHKFEDEICNHEFSEEEKRLHVGVRVVGDWSLIPADLREKIAEAMIQRREHRSMIVNLAIAYTSRHEIASGAEYVRRAVARGELEPSDITQGVLSKSLQILPSYPVDLLIRTSNTQRLSDFLLWQSSEAVLHFVKHEWPEFSFWDLWHGIFRFQRRERELAQLRRSIESFPTTKSSQEVDEEAEEKSSSQRQSNFISKLEGEYWEQIESDAGMEAVETHLNSA